MHVCSLQELRILQGGCKKGTLRQACSYKVARALHAGAAICGLCWQSCMACANRCEARQKQAVFSISDAVLACAHQYKRAIREGTAQDFDVLKEVLVLVDLEGRQLPRELIVG